MVDSPSPRRQRQHSALSLLLLASCLLFEIASASLAPQQPNPTPPTTTTSTSDYGRSMKGMFNSFSMKDDNDNDDDEAEVVVDHNDALLSPSRSAPSVPPPPPLRTDPVTTVDDEEETETWKSKAEWWKDPLSLFDDDDEEDESEETESLVQDDTKPVPRAPFGETLEEILEETLVDAIVADEEEDKAEELPVKSEKVVSTEDAPSSKEEEIETGMLDAATSPPASSNAFSKLLAPAAPRAPEREPTAQEESSLSPSPSSQSPGNQRQSSSSSSSVAVATPLSLLALQVLPKARILLQVLPAVEVLTVCTVVGGAVVAKFLPKLAFLSNSKSDADMNDQDIIDEYRNKQTKQTSRRQQKKLDLDSDLDERAVDGVDDLDQDERIDLDDIRSYSRGSPVPENAFFETEHTDTSRRTSASGTRRKKTKRRRRSQTPPSDQPPSLNVDVDAASMNDPLNQIDESDVSSAAFKENLNKSNNRNKISWPKFTFRNPLPYRPPAGELALSKRELAQAVQELKTRVASAESEKTNMEASYEQASWQLQETTTELAGSKQTAKYLQAQLRDNEEMLERVVRSERRKGKEELMKMKDAMVKVVEREREAMRDEFMKQAAELQTLWQEQNENEEVTVPY